MHSCYHFENKNSYLEAWALRVLLHLGGLLAGACAGGNKKGQGIGKGLFLLTPSWMVTDSQRTLCAFVLSPGDGRYGNNDDSEAGEFESQDFCWKPQGDIVLAHSHRRVGLPDLPLNVSAKEL